MKSEKGFINPIVIIVVVVLIAVGGGTVFLLQKIKGKPEIEQVLNTLDDAKTKLRDTRRITDIKLIQLNVEIYYDAHGDSYPESLSMLDSQPADPSTGKPYFYARCGAQNYHIGANLETKSSGLNSDDDKAPQCAEDKINGDDNHGCDGQQGVFCYDFASFSGLGGKESTSVPENKPVTQQKSGTTMVVGPYGFFFFNTGSSWNPIDEGSFKLVLGRKDSAGKQKAVVIMKEMPPSELTKAEGTKVSKDVLMEYTEEVVKDYGDVSFSRRDSAYRWGGVPAFRIEALSKKANLKLVYVGAPDSQGNYMELSFSSRPEDFSTYVQEFEEMLKSTTVTNK